MSILIQKQVDVLPSKNQALCTAIQMTSRLITKEHIATHTILLYTPVL